MSTESQTVTETPQNAKEIEVSEGETLRVTFSGAGGRLIVNEQEYSLKDGIIVPTNVANDQQTSSLGQRAYEVGQRLRDGTVVLSVDLNKNEALFVPAKIFGGEAKFYDQNDVVKSANRDTLHGHNDWRRITDDEGETLSKNWDKVAPAELQDRDHPWFWLASPGRNSLGRVRGGGEAGWHYGHRSNSLPVLVVRSGPTRILDI